MGAKPIYYKFGLPRSFLSAYQPHMQDHFNVVTRLHRRGDGEHRPKVLSAVIVLAKCLLTASFFANRISWFAKINTKKTVGTLISKTRIASEAAWYMTK